VSLDVNTIRTVLPKSTREAAHSPPRVQTNNTSPIKLVNPIPTIVTVDCTSPPITTEKTNPKTITEPISTKYFHRNSDSVISSCLSEPINSEELLSSSVPRKFLNSSIQK
jgi:hypothetical protein